MRAVCMLLALTLVAASAFAGDATGIARPVGSRFTSVAGSGAVTEPPVYRAGREISLRRAPEGLTLLDCKHLRLMARAKLQGDPWPVPGNHLGERMPVCHVVVERTDGPGLDLLRLRGRLEAS